ncbi:MAG: hypothetical protein AAB783_01135 [Patescibacteria group bacterium]
MKRPWLKILLALVANFIIVGSGFSLYGKFWVGFLYLIPFAFLRVFQEQIGAIWQIAVMVISFVHLCKVIKADPKRSG